MLKIGDRLPDFRTHDQFGSEVDSDQLLGKKIVLYFYPKDDTPGCTKEACHFRDNFEAFKNINVDILGIGKGNQASHRKFVDKFSLPFRLLVDDDNSIGRAFGVWGERSLYGRKFYGYHRITFIIDEKGKIKNVFTNVNVEKHVEEILLYLDSIKNEVG